METFEAIRSRHSVRSYRSDPVGRELVERIVEAGRLAPTARNVQPWEFVVVTDAEQRRKLAELAEYGKFIADAPVCIAVLSKPTKYFLEDGSAATTQILLEAHDCGLGACWVAGHKKEYADQVVSLLGAPEEMILISLVSIGYASGEPKVAPKRTHEEVVHWERW